MGFGSPRSTRWPLLLSLSLSLLQGCDSTIGSAGRGGDLAFCMGPLLGLRGEGGGVEGCAPRRRGCCIPMMLAGPLGKVGRGLRNSNGEKIEEAANHAAVGHHHRPFWPGHRLNRRISVGTRAGSDPAGAGPEKQEAKRRKRARSSRPSGEFMGVKTGWFFRLWRQYKVYRRRKVGRLLPFQLERVHTQTHTNTNKQTNKHKHKHKHTHALVAGMACHGLTWHVSSTCWRHPGLIVPVCNALNDIRESDLAPPPPHHHHHPLLHG